MNYVKVPKSKYQSVVAKYKSGLTLDEVGALFDISHERVRQILVIQGYHHRHDTPDRKCSVRGCSELVSEAKKICTYHKARSDKGLPPWPGPLKSEIHGEQQCFNAGCRCKKCRKTDSDRNKAFQSKVSAEIVNGIHPRATHGTANGYFNYRCRCEKCKRAGSIQNRLMREQRSRRANRAA